MEMKIEKGIPLTPRGDDGGIRRPKYPFRETDPFTVFLLALICIIVVFFFVVIVFLVVGGNYYDMEEMEEIMSRIFDITLIVSCFLALILAVAMITLIIKSHKSKKTSIKKNGTIYLTNQRGF